MWKANPLQFHSKESIKPPLWIQLCYSPPLPFYSCHTDHLVITQTHQTCSYLRAFALAPPPAWNILPTQVFPSWLDLSPFTDLLPVVIFSVTPSQTTLLLYPLFYIPALMFFIELSLMAQMVKNPPAGQETWIQSPGRKDALEKEMATHSSILAWEIPWTEEPGRLHSMGLQRVRHNWLIHTFTISASSDILQFSLANLLSLHTKNASSLRARGFLSFVFKI